MGGLCGFRAGNWYRKSCVNHENLAYGHGLSLKTKESMNVIFRLSLSVLYLAFPGLKKAAKQDEIGYQYRPVQRNEVCYCRSGRKYKRCHLLENCNNKEVALHEIAPNGKTNIVLVRQQVADQLLGIRQQKIEVQQTFSSTEIGMAAGSIR